LERPLLKSEQRLSGTAPAPLPPSPSRKKSPNCLSIPFIDGQPPPEPVDNWEGPSSLTRSLPLSFRAHLSPPSLFPLPAKVSPRERPLNKPRSPRAFTNLLHPDDFLSLFCCWPEISLPMDGPGSPLCPLVRTARMFPLSPPLRHETPLVKRLKMPFWTPGCISLLPIPLAFALMCVLFDKLPSCRNPIVLPPPGALFCLPPSPTMSSRF